MLLARRPGPGPRPPRPGPGPRPRPRPGRGFPRGGGYYPGGGYSYDYYPSTEVVVVPVSEMCTRRPDPVPPCAGTLVWRDPDTICCVPSTRFYGADAPLDLGVMYQNVRAGDPTAANWYNDLVRRNAAGDPEAIRVMQGFLLAKRRVDAQARTGRGGSQRFSYRW